MCFTHIKEQSIAGVWIYCTGEKHFTCSCRISTLEEPVSSVSFKKCLWGTKHCMSVMNRVGTAGHGEKFVITSCCRLWLWSEANKKWGISKHIRPVHVYCWAITGPMGKRWATYFRDQQRRCTSWICCKQLGNKRCIHFSECRAHLLYACKAK